MPSFGAISEQPISESGAGGGGGGGPPPTPAVLFFLRRRRLSARARREPEVEEIGERPRRRRGLLPWKIFTQTYRDGYRVADASKAVYELYAGEDAPVDFTTPVAVSASKPFSWSPTLPGPGLTKTLRLVTRERNQYDLLSFNVGEKIKVIDHSGAEVLGPVSAPTEVAVFDGVTGSVRVVAKYRSDDDANPATHWEIFAKVGSDPVPGVDSPVYSAAIGFVGTEAGLARDAGSYSAGASLHVLVAAKRASDGRRGLAAVVVKVLATTIDLDDEDGDLFGGAARFT